MKYRNGEETSMQFRTQRFFCITGEWFFSTRERVQVGPFNNRDEAEIELMLYLRHVNEGGIYGEQFARGGNEVRL